MIVSFLVQGGYAPPVAAEGPSKTELRAVIRAWRNVRILIEEGKPAKGDIQVYYLFPIFKDLLNADQKRQIIEKARHIDRWRDLWFITVSANCDNIFNADLFFMPDTTTAGRVRQGRAVCVRNDLGVRTWDYNYVQIGQRPPEKFQPQGAELPLEMPEGFTLEEVVALSELIYSPEAGEALDH